MKDAIKIFNNYYSKFDPNSKGIKLKYEHTFGVVKYAKDIATSLNMSKEDIDLACKCALFHDIARFKQWKEYNTFLDDLSFDHGDEGYNVLKELNINDKIILLSTKYHNKYKIDNSLNEREKMFCNITRDADKLDILISQINDVIEDEVDISDDIVNTFNEHKLLTNIDSIDTEKYYYLLRELAFIFDINYKESYKIIYNEDFVNKKCDLILKKNEKIEEIRNICNEYLKERISD